MNRRWILWGVTAAVLLQLAVLGGEYLNAAYPLWVGREVRLETVPVDPRSLFRGNYAQLRYAINREASEAVRSGNTPRIGEVVYVRLKPGGSGVHVFDGVSFEAPESGLFIRGRVDYQWGSRIRFGIEAYFLPKEKAQDLERELRHGGIARVMVAGNGKAALMEVTPRPEPLPQEDEGTAQE